MTGTHLEVVGDVDEVPQTKKGNPIPGHFEYGQVPIEPCDNEWEATVDVPDNCSDLIIAAHADVKATAMNTGAISGFLTDLGGLTEQPTISVQYPYLGADSYFQSTLSGAGDLNGIYDGWCVDVDHTIGQNVGYPCNLYSSYDLPLGIVDKPLNMDKVNCLINQNLVGQDAGGILGTYTYGDQQRTIWALIDEKQSTSGLKLWSPYRVAEMLEIANSEQCDDFVPACYEKIAILCVPVNGAQVTIAQVTLFELDPDADACSNPDLIDVLGEETAWGAGTEFVEGKSWATYIDAVCPMP